MSSELLNPYAAPAEPKLEPIRFRGRLTPEILHQSTREQWAHETSMRVAGWICVAIVVPGSLWHIYEGWKMSDRIYPIAWVLLGVTCFMAFWLPLVIVVNNRTGAAGRRLRRLSASLPEYRGWIDDDGLTRWTDRSALRCSWRRFGTPTLLPDQIHIRDPIDDRIKIILPWYFFDSPDSFQAACNFLHERSNSLEVELPDPNVAIELFGEQRQKFDFETSAADSWSANHWPPDGDYVEGETFDVHLGRQTNLVVQVLFCLGVLGGATIMLWPILLPLAMWLAYDSLYFGNWNFLSDNAWANSPVFVTIAGIFVAAVWFLWQQLIAERHRDAMQITLSPRGIQTHSDDGDYWWDRTEIIEVETSNSKASFLTIAEIDSFVLRVAAFDDEQTFRTFCKRLQQFESNSTTRR